MHVTIYWGKKFELLYENASTEIEKNAYLSKENLDQTGTHVYNEVVDAAVPQLDEIRPAVRTDQFQEVDADALGLEQLHHGSGVQRTWKKL